MPERNRLQRLLRLLGHLQSGRVYNSAQLADAVDVSRRTVFRDLRLLEHSGVPVVFDDERQGYLVRSQVLLPTADFTLEETLSLLVLCHELGDSSQGIPFYRPAWSAAMKLLSNLPHRLRVSATKVSESISLRLEPHNPLKVSASAFDLLSHALAQRKQVRVLYESLDEQKQISTVISPYHLLFSRRSWYVIGRSSLHRQVRTFNVARVQKAEVLEHAYRIPKRFSLDRYLGNAWHLIREPRERHKIVVRFQRQVAQNVAEVRWHRTQKLVWNKDGSLDFHVTVDGLREIVWWILGYGSQAEVLKPAKLRDMIRRHVLALHQVYDGHAPQDLAQGPRAERKGAERKGPHFLKVRKATKRARKR